jgi:hypothetical protein
LEYISIPKSGNCTKHADRLQDSAMVTTVGFFPILVALHAGLFLELNNISQEHVTRAHCQMLLHLLWISRADDNDDDVLVNLADDLDEDDKALAHTDGMSEDDNVEEVYVNAAQNDDVDDDNSDAAQENMDNEGDTNAGEDNDAQCQ